LRTSAQIEPKTSPGIGAKNCLRVGSLAQAGLDRALGP
jgi:hypothetical protein